MDRSVPDYDSRSLYRSVRTAPICEDFDKESVDRGGL